MILGNILEVCPGATDATCFNLSSAVDLTLHSGLCNASKITGTTIIGNANGLAMDIIASDASSAAARTPEDEEPHSSSAAASNGTTYGSTDFIPSSHNALRNNSAPSRAFTGVVFPLFESVPIELVAMLIVLGLAPVLPVPILRMALSESILAKLALLQIFLIPPPGCTPFPGPLPNTAPMPSGNSVFSISASTPNCLSTTMGPRCFTNVAKSAAAAPRDCVVEAVCGLAIPSWNVARSPMQCGKNSLTVRSFCCVGDKARNASREVGWFSSDGRSLGADPRRCSPPFPLVLFELPPLILDEVPDLRMPDFLPPFVAVFFMPTL
mmetsp:Transcript_26960/g.45936  ORF Transcript_26960/g.45936 Transcript_26960/m.45936 type:complete len:324 (+) Transcript_26960:898-1869(+)